MPGVANTTIGPGLSVYERSNGCTVTQLQHFMHVAVYFITTAAQEYTLALE